MPPTGSTSDGNKQGFSLAGAGTKLLRKIVSDPRARPQDQRKEVARQQVAGEVIVIVLGPGGDHKASYRVFIRDLSRGGCGLWSRAMIEANTQVMVVFNGPNGKPVHKLSRVTHCRGQENTGYALGIRFDHEVDATAKTG